MTEVKTKPVKAMFCEDIDLVRETPGAFEFYSYQGVYPAGMIYNCPCGCGKLGSLQFSPSFRGDKPSWQWNGSKERPTLAPSIWDKGHWHGWLTDGEWRSC